jgi:hypothetical protein
MLHKNSVASVNQVTLEVLSSAIDEIVMKAHKRSIGVHE